MMGRSPGLRVIVLRIPPSRFPSGENSDADSPLTVAGAATDRAPVWVVPTVFPFNPAGFARSEPIGCDHRQLSSLCPEKRVGQGAVKGPYDGCPFLFCGMLLDSVRGDQ